MRYSKRTTMTPLVCTTRLMIICIVRFITRRAATELMKSQDNFAIHHAFCFISYKMGEFQKYLDEVVKPGEHP